MREIPEDIWEAARSLRNAVNWNSNESVELIARAILAERGRIQTLLMDPAAVRVNYLRGDIACQPLIDEAVEAERQRYQWQPIETAPHGAAGKPSTYVMLSKQEQGTTLVCTGYVNRHGAYEWFGGGMMGLTHWMPLPAAPKGGDA